MRADQSEGFLKQLGSVKFVKTSKGYMTNCPLQSRHRSGRDKNPSLQVFDGDPTICSCFACGFKGKLFFLAKECGAGRSLLDSIDAAEGFDPIKQLKNLSSYDSIPNVVKYGGRKTADLRQVRRQKVFKDGQWFTWGSEEGESAPVDMNLITKWRNAPYPKYLQSRNVPPEVYALWGMGHDVDGYEVKKTRPDGSEYIVNFGPRVVFITYDEQWKPVGWSGRSVYRKELRPKFSKRDGVDVIAVRGRPKYYHMPGAKKDWFMFGMHMVEKRSDVGIVVEGPLDVINVCMSGYVNALAIQGSYLSSRQVQYLTKNFKKIVLLPDGDDAGIACMKRSFEALKGCVTVKIAGVIDGKDPGDLTYSELKNCIESVFVEEITENGITKEVRYVQRIEGTETTDVYNGQRD